MSYCGVDVAAGRGSHLCVLEERRHKLEVTFYEPGTVAEIAAEVASLGPAVVAIDAPQAPRRNLLAEGSPLREKLGLKPGVHHRSRVCDALMVGHGLFLYQVPDSRQEAPVWMQHGFELFELLERQFAPTTGGYEGRVSPDDRARVIETYPDACFCTLLGERPASKRTPVGIARRIEALEASGVVDVEADLRQRTLDELDACAAALTAHHFAHANAYWVGHPAEGVIVLPVPELKDRYAKPADPTPRRTLGG